MATFVSPGVYVIEQDFSLYIPNLSTTILGLVGAAQKGPLNEATQITSAVEFIQTFGEPAPTMFGPYAALQYLQEGSTMYYCRVAGPDAYTALFQIPSAETGGTDVAAVAATALPGPFAITLSTNDTLTITEIDYSSGSYVTTVRTITLTAGGARTATQILADITGTAGYASFNFTAAIPGGLLTITDKNKTNQKGFVVGGNARITLGFDSVEHYGVDVTALPATIAGSQSQPFNISGSNDTLKIVENDLRSGSPAVLTTRTVTLTHGATQTALQVAADINTAARSGSWNVLAAASGTSVVLSSATIENELFGLSIDGSTTVPGATATTLGFNDSEVFYGAKAKWLIQALNEGAWGNDISIVLGAGSIANTYKIDVYYLQALVESFDKMSSNSSDDTFVEKVINGVSNYITVTDNASLGLPPTLTVTSAPGDFLILGSDDLADLGDAQYIGEIDPSGAATGLQVYANPEVININLVAIPGVSSGAVLNAEIDLCVTRGDAMAIVDPPFGLSSANVIKWHNGVTPYDDHQAFDSSYAALYWPWVQIFDPVNNQKVWTPPSGHLSRVYAYTDRTTETWYAPAGTQRGHIIPALTVEHSATRGERDLMYGNGNAINPIINIPQTGITVWGQRTLQRAPTARDRVNVRRLLLYLEKVIATASQFLVFEPNDTILWAQFTDLVTPFCDSVKARRGLYDFAVRCDKTTNPPDAIDRNEMHAYILLKPTKTAEQIIVTFTLTTTGANFNEIASF